ncbi:iron complex outermembrane recepter protein [Novosphingobium sp. CF614]|uniref:TonB-dependent receptor n=1 Tax=Novosphingobium sp. CF614 TaxID=1884364 RepID=UPI0008E1D9F5|nr:TonB-dependent receptor [Novosphingobium sp. CF614]SFF83069.1 iron complex outermembrane recepter protein [Novosphingobium sp. CF614]
MRNNISRWAVGSSLVAAAYLFPLQVHAQSASAKEDEAEDGSTITVTGWKLRKLDAALPTGSRLGLSVRETPATIDQIDSNEILTRGFRTVEEATVSLPGVTSGGSPGDPSLFSMRGFTGEQITILHNGLYLGPANMINRPGNTFNIASIDVLKGPASVLYGQGAIGGAVNIVNKHPDFTGDSFQALGSYATFNTVSAGFGGNKVLSDDVALRLDASYHTTDGYVKDAGSNSLNATGALLYQPTKDFSLEFSVDYLKDNLSNYFGTPLVPAADATDPIPGILSSSSGMVVDRAMRFVNYNVSDSRDKSWQVWPKLVLNWKVSDNLTLSNTAYWFHAERQWVNAEVYSYNSTTKLIDRDRFFVFHNQDLIGDQFSATFDSQLFGLQNKIVAGVDYSHLDFIRSRGFPDGDSVDPSNPDPGLFGPIAKRVSPTRWDQAALFAEDVLSLTPSLKLVTGLRAENLYLTRENYNVDGSFNAGSSFKRTYKLFNWRAGLVYDLAPMVTAYVSYSTGKDPVGSNIFLVNASQNFGLSSSHQVESGLKADLMDGRGSLTLSAYDIKRKNILTLVGTDTLSNVGSQTSKGVELSGQFKVTNDWTLIASGTYVDAEYGDFVDPNYGIAATGNTPPNVPAWVGNVWTSYRNVGGLPLEMGGGVKYVGKRYGNTANDLVLKSYATGIVYATYEVSPNISVTGRVNNVWNQTFVQWADIYYPTQVVLGEPRRIEVSFLGRF